MRPTSSIWLQKSTGLTTVQSALFAKELERASELGAKYVMTHLGSVKDLSEEESVKKIIEGMKKFLMGMKARQNFL